MTKFVDQCITQADDETWTFRCVGFTDDRCGDRDTGEPFTSSGWPTKKSATARGEQHLDEHRLSFHAREALAQARAEADDPESVDPAKVLAETADRHGFSLMQELHDFRVDQGLVVNDDGSVSVTEILPAASKES